jgi:glycosyltransferase involved in cell wall biosynthesis
MAVFTSQYPARVSTFFARDIRGLREAGWEIEVFAVRPLDEDLWKFVPDGPGDRALPRDRVHHLGAAAGFGRGFGSLLRHGGQILRESARILPAAARWGPASLAKTAYVLPKAWTWAETAPGRFDHVLAYWGNYAATCAYLFHRLRCPDVPFSMFLHAGTDLYRSPAFLSQKLRYADNVVTVCDFNRRFLLDRYAGLGPSLDRKIIVHHLGLDLSALAYAADGRSPTRVVGVGSFEPVKGFDDLIRAAALVKQGGTPIELELIGRGPEERRLRELARQLGLEAQTSFPGWLSFGEVEERIRSAAVLVHPSTGLGDAVPTVIKEAMALGTPVVATRVAGIPELLDDGRCGILVAPRDVAGLAAGLGRLLADDGERRELALRARGRAEEMLDLSRNGARLASRLRGTVRAGQAGETR